MDCVWEIIEGEASHKEIKVVFVCFFLLFLPLTSGIVFRERYSNRIFEKNNQPNQPKTKKEFHRGIDAKKTL